VPFSISSSLTGGAARVEAAGWIIRQPGGKGDVWQGGWGIRAYRSDLHIAFALDKPAVLVFTASANGATIYNGGDTAVAVTFSQPFSRTETLAPGVWTAIYSLGTRTVAAPELFPPLISHSTASYANYLKAQPAAAASVAQSIKIKAADLTIPAGVILNDTKIGAGGPVITKWNTNDMTLSARADIAQPGWYRVKLRYCSGTGCMVSLLINGALPFEEAEGLSLPATKGAPPSDGWSNQTDDWQDLALGSDITPRGLKIFLPPGSYQIGLREDGGAGASLASVSLEPALP